MEHGSGLERMDYHDSREDGHHREKGFEKDEAIMKRSVLVTEKYPGGINCYLELILVLSDTAHHQWSTSGPPPA